MADSNSNSKYSPQAAHNRGSASKLRLIRCHHGRQKFARDKQLIVPANRLYILGTNQALPVSLKLGEFPAAGLAHPALVLRYMPNS